ncbi:MAG: hypothetical protein CM1200mP3_07110 [Chloroflexota bacterium]|nr:MAG: hypothetical protein CM1200mP3_07110 [Chloroflexota bacterium]
MGLPRSVGQLVAERTKAEGIATSYLTAADISITEESKQLPMQLEKKA